MGMFSWVLAGAAIGWIAGHIVKKRGLGLFMDILVGIVGAFIGGLVTNLFGGVGFVGFSVYSLLAATAACSLLLGFVGLLNRNPA